MKEAGSTFSWETKTDEKPKQEKSLPVIKGTRLHSFIKGLIYM